MPARRAACCASASTGMRDRVLALNGALHLRQLSPGLRLHLLVRQDGVAPQ